MTHLTAAERYDEALRCAERCLELTRKSGRGGRLLLDVALVYIEILARQLDAAALAQLHARGAALSDGSIGAIAFATNDAP